MQPVTKTYKAIFHNLNGHKHKIYVDAITDTHAHSRAWILFMKTKWYEVSPDGWDLQEVKEL